MALRLPRSRKRLTDSFFKLVGRDWVPPIIDDLTFPVSVLTGGRKLPGWGLREECVTRLLFETGGRIFEITGLTLGDWVTRGLTRETTAASKGSHGRRVKFFRFSSETATLLRRYFDGERRSHDRTDWNLADYLRAADDKLTNLHDVPSSSAAYDHYFDAARHADIQDQLHERLWVALEQGLKRRSSRIVPAPASPATPRIADPDLRSSAASEEPMPELAWDSLADRFHPMVLATPKTAVDPLSSGRWPAIHPRVIIWLHRHGAGHPWSDHLALAATVMVARRLDLATVLGYSEPFRPSCRLSSRTSASHPWPTGMLNGPCARRLRARCPSRKRSSSA